MKNYEYLKEVALKLVMSEGVNSDGAKVLGEEFSKFSLEGRSRRLRGGGRVERSRPKLRRRGGRAQLEDFFPGGSGFRGQRIREIAEDFDELAKDLEKVKETSKKIVDKLIEDLK